MPAAGVELLELNRLLVRGDLEDRVRRRVDDPLTSALVLLAQLLDDLRPGRRLVAEHAATGSVHERIDHVVRKAMRIRRHRLRRDNAHQLPVAGRRVLALRPLDQPTRHGRRAGLRRTALERRDVAEPERLEVRQVQPADGPGHVSERVRPFVAVFGGIRELTRSNGIEHDDARPRHAAILGWPWPTSLD